jgi:SAM-dependent methyltransferase
LEVFKSLVERTKGKYPGYRFSWEIYTEIILEKIAEKPYWLDIGAGSNIWIKEQPGAEFSVGLDIEKNANSFVDNNTGAYVIATSESLPFKEGSFNFITSRYTFEHLEKPEISLKEIRRVLKPRGTFTMQTTNRKNPAIFFARLVPFRIKKIIYKKIFKNIPSGTFKTFYKINTPEAIARQSGYLNLQKLILVEDLLCQSRLLYYASLSLFKIINKFHLDSIKNNIIAIFKKAE